MTDESEQQSGAQLTFPDTESPLDLRWEQRNQSDSICNCHTWLGLPANTLGPGGLKGTPGLSAMLTWNLDSETQ